MPTHVERQRLLHGATLMSNPRAQSARYFLGTLNNVVAITSPFERTALMQIAEGRDPIAALPLEARGEIQLFLERLRAHGFLISAQPVHTPERYLPAAHAADLAAQQLQERIEIELTQVDWISGGESAEILAARGDVPLLFSGRGRVISLLYSILLASGVTRLRFADRFQRPTVEGSDSGFGAITANDLGLHYYETLEKERRSLSLFPIKRGAEIARESDAPVVVIHYGECDPELLWEWSNRKVPHLLIQPPVGDEIVIGPLVIPGSTPCLRCFSLYEIDHFGFTRSERLGLTSVEELPAAIAHYCAAIVASQILHFIDSRVSKERVMERNTGIGEATYINFQRLTEPQVVALARHPLCGCDR